MFFWNSYPFVRYTTSLIAGIVCFEKVPELWSYPWLAVGLLFVFHLVLNKVSQKIGYFKVRHWMGIITLSIFFYIGGWCTQIHYHNFGSIHYSNQSKEIIGFTGTISSPVNERKNHFRFDFEIERLFTSDSIIHSSGKTHLYIRKDSSDLEIKYGDQLAVFGRLYPIPGPDNPNEFDYRLYLKRQNIFCHSFVQNDDVQIIGHEPPNAYMQWAYSLRSAASSIIDQHIPESRENGIAKALFLGIKDHLDNEVKQAYSAAGAMHVLAVSGLHVGIIYLLINLLFGRISNLGKSGNYAFGLISVSLIWLYAAMTGLSPSVLRAGTMFTFVAIGQASAREGNIYNTLAIAAFVLLIFQPYLIYSVGFQLSFAAVLGIVYLQPKMYRLFEVRNGLLDKAWAITCVSLAAQISTFPLTAYYFHQFPTYFLASNLIVIPASFIMLTGGIAMIIISFIYMPLGASIGNYLGKFMWIINEIIGYVHQLPHSLIKWIYLDQAELLLSYIIVGLFIGALHFRSFQTLVTSAIAGVIFMFTVVSSNHQQSKRHELVFYEISKKLAIDNINGHSSTLYIDDYKESELELLAFQINPHRLASHLAPIQNSIVRFREVGFIQDQAFWLGQIEGLRLVVFDSTTFHLNFKNLVETDFIVIQNQSVKSLKWLSEHFEFDQIILGHGNSRYYVHKMKSEGEKLDLKIHSLSGDGAFRYSVK